MRIGSENPASASDGVAARGLRRFAREVLNAARPSNADAGAVHSAGPFPRHTFRTESADARG